MPDLSDMKQALTSAHKADITHVRRCFMNYTSRACEYGNNKYERANYLRPVSPTGSVGPTAADVNRYRAYLRAVVSHTQATLDALEEHQSSDPDFQDVEGFTRACYAPDTDTKPGDKIGPSLLPHVAHAAASLQMAIAQAVKYGLLPEDPGAPWRS